VGEDQPREIGLEPTIRSRSGFVQGRQEPSHPSRHPAVTMTGRQLECLAWAGEGKTAFEIGVILGISARTAEGHLAKACEALGVRRRIQAAIKAREMGLLPSLGR
jgi:LuxR family transcriptional regulator of spore coat protein